MIERVKQSLSNGPSRPPRVIVAERVIRKIARGATLYLDEETAEALVGLVVPNEQGEPDLVVLDTIAPDQAAIDRGSYMVAQGDDLQDEIMYSLAINWRRFRAHPASDDTAASPEIAEAARWDVPLRYLGDWHKQPGEMFWPSGGDLQTAQAIVRDADNDMPQIVAPIVTLAPAWDPAVGPPGDEFDVYATQEDGPDVRINFWYLSRKMRQFVAARPEVLPDDQLPALPPLNWHLIDHDRFHEECDLLSDDGLALSVTEWDADGQAPMELCFMIGRIGGQHVLILVTGRDFPQAAPEVRTAPMLKIGKDEDMFERLWAASAPLAAADLPDWPWTPERRLVELVRSVEARRGETPPPQDAARDVAQADPVSTDPAPTPAEAAAPEE